MKTFGQSGLRPEARWRNSQRSPATITDGGGDLLAEEAQLMLTNPRDAMLDIYSVDILVSLHLLQLGYRKA